MQKQLGNLFEGMLPLYKAPIYCQTEQSINLRTDTHRNDVWRKDVPQCDKHFQNLKHNFNEHDNLKPLKK